MSSEIDDVDNQKISADKSDTVINSNELSDDKIQELDTSYRILREIIRQQKSTCWPFMDKVDIKGLGLWDYEVKVKEPMWLNKMLDKFERGEYSGIADFAKDFRTMVENCYRYNGTDHTISKKAKRLEMAFEGKLALLKRELRDKALISITSNGKFSIDINNDELVPVSRYGRLGNNREYASILDDNTAKLVYDFVRCEETMLHDDEKKASYRERRQQEMLYQKIAAAWISTIEDSPDIACMKTSHALPEVGFFIHICETPLKFPELNMYQLERCFIVPERSLYLSKLMTCLLCTYQERTQISQRPPMHFKTWNTRLKERLEKWFELVQKYDSYSKAASKVGISVEFFQSLNWRNPFIADEKESYTDLTYDQKVQILKALCDCLVSLQSVQNAFYSLDAAQLQCMQLGKDYLGNVYIYFPQFCGDDVRVYRHRDYGVPEPISTPDEIWTPPLPPTEEDPEASNVTTPSTPEEPESDTNKCDTTLPQESEAQPMVNGHAENTDISLADGGDHNEQSIVSEDDSALCAESKAKKELDFSAVQEVFNSTSNSDGKLDLEAVSLETIIPEPVVVKRSTRIRKQTTRYTDENASSQRKRTPRKRAQQEEEQDSPKKRKKAETPKNLKSKRDSNRESVTKYGNVDFEMLCDTVNALQLLISELESQQTKENKAIYGRKAFERHQELIDKIRWLYDELEPWNIRLQKSRLSIQVQMKKEHDEIVNSLNKVDSWTEELSGKNTYVFGENLTISHADSPMSSVASFDGDDEEYMHPYFTRKSITPEFEKIFDEAVYESERETLLPAALYELEELLRDNIKELLKLADREELQENNVSNDRRTRQKIRQQNKVLGKVICFAERKVEIFPTLLPILVPNEDVYEVVDMIFLEEETRVQEMANEQRRKRLERSSRRQALRNSTKDKELEKSTFDRIKTVHQSPAKKTPTRRADSPQTLAIRMQNGRVLAATRLSDGRVVPIVRGENSSIASSVEELVENTLKPKKSTVDTTPTISLRASNSPRKETQDVTQSLPTATNNIQSSTQTIPTLHSENSQPVATSSNQNNPVIQAIPRVPSVRPIILNCTRYAFVPRGPAASIGQRQPVIASPISTQTVTSVQPVSILRPVIAPIQIVAPVIKCQPQVQPNNVVYIPFQNRSNAIRINPTTVVGVISSPVRQQPQQKP